MPAVEEDILPPPPPKLLFQHHAQSVATIKRTLNQMAIPQRNSITEKETLQTGIHHWHIAKHVFRSDLIFNRKRRASDSILPLLVKTHQANNARSRADSVQSTLSQTPLENLIDYVTYHKLDENDPSTMPRKIHRSASDVSHCIRRNQLDDSIFQYELILRHLKNHEQFMSTYPTRSTSSKQCEQSSETEQSVKLNEIESKFLAQKTLPHRQTQSLSRNVGRTFSEFIMNDLFPPTVSSNSSVMKEQRRNISHTSSQTDSVELTHEMKNDAKALTASTPSTSIRSERSNSIINEEAKVVLNEFDAILDNNTSDPPITPNSEINVIVLQSPVETVVLNQQIVFLLNNSLL